MKSDDIWINTLSVKASKQSIDDKYSIRMWKRMREILLSISKERFTCIFLHEIQDCQNIFPKQ